MTGSLALKFHCKTGRRYDVHYNCYVSPPSYPTHVQYESRTQLGSVSVYCSKSIPSTEVTLGSRWLVVAHTTSRYPVYRHPANSGSFSTTNSTEPKPNTPPTQLPIPHNNIFFSHVSFNPTKAVRRNPSNRRSRIRHNTRPDSFPHHHLLLTTTAATTTIFLHLPTNSLPSSSSTRIPDLLKHPSLILLLHGAATALFPDRTGKTLAPSMSVSLVVADGSLNIGKKTLNVVKEETPSPPTAHLPTASSTTTTATYTTTTITATTSNTPRTRTKQRPPTPTTPTFRPPTPKTTPPTRRLTRRTVVHHRPGLRDKRRRRVRARRRGRAGA